MGPISYGRQSITEADIEAVNNVLKSDYLTQGPMVSEFENAFAKYVQTDHAIAVTNGTAALHLAALTLGVQPGDNVLVTTNSFVASANCIRYCGGNVHFLDIDPNDYCLDLKKLEKTLQAHPKGHFKGIVCVDFAGYPVNTERLREIADQFGLWIIEDACHAVGAQFQNSKGDWVSAGSSIYSDITVFSFHPVKHIAMGEGGMITTRNAKLADHLRTLRTHGIVRENFETATPDGPWYYEMQELGFNYRVSDILCALGLSQLSRMPENIKRRQEIAEIYQKELSSLPLKIATPPTDHRHAYHLFVVLTKKRTELYTFLRERNIFTQVHYIPIHKQPYYQNLKSQSLPEAEKYYSQALSLPMYHSLTNAELAYVIQSAKDFFRAK